MLLGALQEFSDFQSGNSCGIIGPFPGSPRIPELTFPGSRGSRNRGSPGFKVSRKVSGKCGIPENSALSRVSRDPEMRLSRP